MSTRGRAPVRSELGCWARPGFPLSLDCEKDAVVIVGSSITASRSVSKLLSVATSPHFGQAALILGRGTNTPRLRSGSSTLYCMQFSNPFLVASYIME
jgi:hypothetical protein